MQDKAGVVAQVAINLCRIAQYWFSASLPESLEQPPEASQPSAPIRIAGPRLKCNDTLAAYS